MFVNFQQLAIEDRKNIKDSGPIPIFILSRVPGEWGEHLTTFRTKYMPLNRVSLSATLLLHRAGHAFSQMGPPKGLNDCSITYKILDRNSQFFSCFLANFFSNRVTNLKNYSHT